jgi:ABC-type lipoprotein release transport system permease subunit
VAIVNEAMARAYFAGADPIGRAIGFGSTPERLLTIVGVVRDARQQLREEPPRMVYTPLAQIVEPPKDLLAAVMTDGSTASLAPAVRSVVSGLTRDVAVTYVRSMRQQISASLVIERLVAGLASAFGGLALVLACVGLYGVMSYDIARRTRDIGIRMALGAHPGSVLAAVLREVGVIAGIGLGIGIVGAALVSRVVTDLLFGLTSRDPVTLVIATAVLGLTAMFAGYFPARRAARVNPAVALRAE